jgi:hypothetical protein
VRLECGPTSTSGISHASLLVGAQVPCLHLFVSFMLIVPLSMTSADCGNTLGTVVLSIIRYVRKILLQTNYSVQDAHETRSSTFGSRVALSPPVYRGPMSLLWVKIKESKKPWSTCNYCQLEYLGSLISRTERSCSSSLPIGRTIYLPWHSNHQYQSHHVLQLPPAYNVLASFRSTLVFVVPPASLITSPISCIVSHAPP